MKKLIAFALLILLAVPPAYCADKKYIGGYPRTTANDKGQTVLAPGDYTLVASEVHGKSKGFLLLGVLPLWFATQSRAMDDLYDNAGVTKEGASLANVYQVKDHHYFILGTVTTCDVAADIVKINSK